MSKPLHTYVIQHQHTYKILLEVIHLGLHTLVDMVNVVASSGIVSLLTSVVKTPDSISCADMLGCDSGQEQPLLGVYQK